MKCGNCKRDDDEVTVDHVRACYAQKQNDPATDKQKAFIATLLAERDMTDGANEERSKVEASELIDWLLKHPPTQSAKPEQEKIPAGYYATPSTGGNDLDFWHVEIPTEGKWAGYVFVKRVLGGHSDLTLPRDSKKKVKSTKVARATQTAALEAIRAFGVEKSHHLFGTELKFCRECGIHLTDETSRALGIGPVCREGRVA